MKICLICVNYNSYQHLLLYAHSVALAYKSCINIFLDFVVVDNSTTEEGGSVIEEIKSLIPGVIYIKSANIGYFPALSLGLASLAGNLLSYDYVAVSNVDLEVATDFFAKLSLATVDDPDGVLAPSVISRHRRSDLNPKIISRPSRRKLEKNLAIFSFPLLFWIYGKLSDFKFRFSRPPSVPSRLIYAPHGSFIVFTNNFFRCGGTLNYPRFLFGEEIFVAEECASRGLSVRYSPELIVFDMDHGATSLQSTRFISSEHSKSLRYLLDKYFC